MISLNLCLAQTENNINKWPENAIFHLCQTENNIYAAGDGLTATQWLQNRLTVT